MDKLDDYVKRLEKVVLKFESIQGGVGGSLTPTTTQPSPGVGGSTTSAAVDSVGAFKQMVDVQVMAVVQTASTINAEGLILPEAYRNEIVAVTDVLRRAFEAEITVVNAMSKCRTPQPSELQKLVAPLVEQLTDANSRTEGKRTDPFNHQKTIAEFLQALVWVGQTAEAGKPSIFVDQCWQNAEFYGNKIMKEFRTQDPKHVKWVEAIKAVALELKRYLNKYHMKEPKWLPDGISVSEFLGQEPPPEMPPVVTPKKEVPKPAPLKATAYWQPDQNKPAPQTAAFTDIKKGLKKVGDQGGSRPVVSPKAAFQGAQLKKTAAPVREPRMELEMDRKWNVEFFKNNKEIIVDQTSPKQTVYIYQCQDSVVQIKGKVNAVTIDGCKKTGVVFEDVVSLVEIINCSRTDVQCTGRVSTITIDKSDECKVFIPESCMNVGITTAKSTSINVTLTTDNPEADPIEHAIPYQFISRFKDGKLVTEAVEHAGAA